MAAIEIVTDGQDVMADWGQRVALALNELQKLRVAMMTADESTNSVTPSDIANLSFPVVSGQTYVFRVTGQYFCAQTNQGLGIGIRHPGGTAIGVWRIFGQTSASVETLERFIEASAATDEMTTSAICNAAGTTYQVEGQINYTCSANGTFVFRKARNGTSGGAGLTLKGPMSVIAHSSAI